MYCQVGAELHCLPACCCLVSLLQQRLPKEQRCVHCQVRPLHGQPRSLRCCFPSGSSCNPLQSSAAHPAPSAQVPSDSVFVTRFMGGYTENVPPDEFDALPVRCTAPSCLGSCLLSICGQPRLRAAVEGWSFCV